MEGMRAPSALKEKDLVLVENMLTNVDSLNFESFCGSRKVSSLEFAEGSTSKHQFVERKMKALKNQ